MKKGSVRSKGTNCTVGRKDSTSWDSPTCQDGTSPGGVPAEAREGPRPLFLPVLKDAWHPSTETLHGMRRQLFVQALLLPSQCHAIISSTHTFKVTLKQLFFPIKNMILILEYSENTKAHKMRIKITLNSTILSNQILWLFGIFLYFQNICARFSCSRNFVTCLFCLNHEQFSMSLYIIQKHVFNDCIKSQSPAVL